MDVEGSFECGNVSSLSTTNIAGLCSIKPRCKAFSVSRPAEGQPIQYCLKNATGPLVDRADTTMPSECLGVYLTATGECAHTG